MDTIKNPLVYTTGEPAGIGTDIVIKLVREGLDYPVIVLGDKNVIQNRASLMGINVPTQYVDNSSIPEVFDRHTLYLQHVVTRHPVTAGILQKDNAKFVLEQLNLAISGCITGQYAGMVTGPVQKSIINDAGIPFSGHTEYLARVSGVAKTVMMLVAKDLRVALLTTHIPLREVADKVKTSELDIVSELVIDSLKKYFGIVKPRVCVLGLNPHAGESGHLGNEEELIIKPWLTAKQTGEFSNEFELFGPLPADTAFTPRQLAQTDVVLAMYHDQGLPVLKHYGFGEAVNITLGLPFIRTSVDHGTALDKAGSGGVEIGSLREAIRIAHDMAKYPCPV